MVDQEPRLEPPPRRRRVWLFYLVLATLALNLGLGLGSIGVASISALGGLRTATGETLAATPAEDAAVPLATSAPAGGVVVPWLVGLPLSRASSLVEGLGLTLVNQGSAYSTEVAAGAVLRQSPAAGTRVQPGQAVSVVVGRGAERVAVPNLVRLTIDAAQLELAGLGLRLFQTTQRVDDVPVGIIFAQTPKAGAEVERGGIVTATVSAGPDLPVVPNVVGLSEEVARQRLLAAGFAVSPWVNYQGRGALPEAVVRQVEVGCVLSTTPKGGDRVPRGTVISLAVRKD